MKLSDKALVMSLALGMVVWLVDAILDFYIFYEGLFLDLLLFAMPEHELYIRSLIMIVFLIFGLTMRSTLNRLALRE